MGKSYWTGYKPMTLVDLINSVSASIGSIGLAQSAAHASYKGHSVYMSFNDRRGYWIAEYTWAGRQVIARGSFNDVLGQALLFHKGNGAAGSLVVNCQNDDQALICAEMGLVEHSMEIANKAYRELLPEWVHNEAVSLVHLQKFKAVDFSVLIRAFNQGMTETQYKALKGSK